MTARACILGAMRLAGFAAALSFTPRPAAADEGGVSFWLPGQLASLAAAPGKPGWTLPVMYYHTSVDAGASRNFASGGNLTAGLEGDADLVFFAPTYVFRRPLFGGQPSLTVAWAFGEMNAGAEAILSGPFGSTVLADPEDSVTGGSDLYPTLSIKWNLGVHNVMTYAAAGVPVGAYKKGRLANIGVNHWSFDAGAGYTYLNPKNRWELSVVSGLTYNFENRATNYQNGVDAHVDAAVSHFLSPRLHVGVAGYFYQQVSSDSGAGAVLGDFKSRVVGVGPEIGVFIGPHKTYLNLRGYYEVDAENRPEGWNALLTLAMSFGKDAE